MPQELKKDDYTKAEVEELLRKEGDETREALEVAELVADMTDAERTHYKSLDGDAKQEFLFADASERTASMEKAIGDNPIVYTTDSGVEIRKSDGALAEKLARDADADRKKIDELTKSNENARLEKLATTDFANLPGELSTRIAMIKAVEAIDDETERTAAMDALKAHNAKMAKAFETVGTGAGAKSVEPGAAEGEMDSLAKKHMSDNPGTTYADAYSKVAEANPELYSKAVNGE